MRDRVRSYRSAFAVLAISLVMTAGATVILERGEREQDRLWIEGVSRDVRARLDDRSDDYLATVRGLRGLFVASHEVDAAEFARYAESMGFEQVPAMSAVVYARAAGASVVVQHVWPEQHSELLGVDLASSPREQAALREAARSGRPVATDGAGFWIFLAVYASPRDVSAGRSREILGFVGAHVRRAPFFEGLVPEALRPVVGYRVYEGEDADPFYEDPPRDGASGSREATTLTVPIAGASRSVELLVHRHGRELSSRIPAAVASIGSIVSVLLFAVMAAQIAGRRAAERLTAELRISDRALRAERSAADRARAGAESALRVRDEFISVAAHELKTPVTTIKGFAQLLQQRDERPPSVGERALRAIDRQVDHIDAIIRELLEVSRLDQQRFELHPERIAVEPLVRGVIERLSPALATHRLDLEVPAPPTLVLADPPRLEQVVATLLSNAAKFSPGGREISVRIHRAGGEVVVSVRDFGLGIPADRREHLFERYYRAHEGTPYAAIGGLGVGLYVSKEIVERHGGRIWFESDEGKGSTFSFSLPVLLDGGAPRVDGGSSSERSGDQKNSGYSMALVTRQTAFMSPTWL